MIIIDLCYEIFDVGFVIDVFGSVGMDLFLREKNFVKLVFRCFVVIFFNMRFGFLVFSDMLKLFVDFVDYESKMIE